MNQLKTSTKMLYGLGFSSQGIKDGLFQLFLFFYYNQILGLDPLVIGVSTLVVLLFDAMSDPIVGMWSDAYKPKKWGKRHPFMFASAIPLGLFIWLLFLPPEGLSENGLFVWLTVFSILVRTALTLYTVPAMTLGAELSEDYDERTSITGIRFMFQAFIAGFIIVLGFLTFFKPTAEVENALFIKEAYPKFAFLCGVFIIICILISTWGTKSEISRLSYQTYKNKTSVSEVLRNLPEAFRLSSFRNLILYNIIVYMGLGIGITFSSYFVTFYFQFSEKVLVLLPIASGVAALLTYAIIPLTKDKIDKKKATIWSTVIFSIFFSAPYILRMVGWFPENGSAALIPLFIFTILIAYAFFWLSLSLTNSMMADVVDEYEVEKQKRNEGMFFSAVSFAYKCSVGLGYLFAGILFTWINFPRKVSGVSEVSQEAIDGLGLVGGPILLTIYLLSLLFLSFYSLTKERYLEIRKILDER